MFTPMGSFFWCISPHVHNYGLSPLTYLTSCSQLWTVSFDISQLTFLPMDCFLWRISPHVHPYGGFLLFLLLFLAIFGLLLLFAGAGGGGWREVGYVIQVLQYWRNDHCHIQHQPSFDLPWQYLQTRLKEPLITHCVAKGRVCQSHLSEGFNLRWEVNLYQTSADH